MQTNIQNLSRSDELELYKDMYGIYRRLLEIDRGYVLVYNRKFKRFEVHNRNQKGNTLAVVCPYEKVDKRLLVHVRRTRAERISKLIEKIEKENREIELSNEKTVKENANDRIKELVKRLKK